MDNLLIVGTNNHYSIYRAIYTPVGSNMYILIKDEEAIIFDSIIDEDAFIFLKKNCIKKIYLFLTHEHYDHSHGVLWMKSNFDVEIYCYKDCKGNLSTSTRSKPRLVAYVLSVMDMNDGGHRYEDFKKEMINYSFEADNYLEDGQVLEVMDNNIRVIHTPGHTPGSCLYLLNNDLVISGDTIIDGNKIITAFRGGDREKMLNITLPILKNLSDDLIILPGHGESFRKGLFKFDIYDI